MFFSFFDIYWLNVIGCDQFTYLVDKISDCFQILHRTDPLNKPKYSFISVATMIKL